MQFLDFSPPAIPTLDQQRDALRKGLGRATQWAAAGLLAKEALLEACLEDQRFDRHFEDNRAGWLWKIMTISGVISQLRDPILDAFRSTNDELDACQFVELALQFALNGDEGFRQQLYDFVGQRQIAESPSIGERQLLRLDGEAALLFLTRIRGRHLGSHNWEWDDFAIVDTATANFGESRVRELLEASDEPEIRRFVSVWRAHTKLPMDRDDQWQTHVQKMKTLSAYDVIVAAQGGEQPNWLRGWGAQADEKDLEAVRNVLSTEQDPVVIATLLRVFANRAMPTFDSRLIELCQHSDDVVRRWAFNALEQNSHPLVREFALQELSHPNMDRPVVSLLIKNFEKGDEQRLLDQVELPGDPCLRHWILMDVIHVLEQNEAADRLKLGQISYFHTPCQECRFYSARLLFDRGDVPAWIAEECGSDANDACHALGKTKCSPDDDVIKEL